MAIDAHDADGRLLLATLDGRRRPFTDLSLARAILGHPLMTLKVFAAIHWQALRLWLKGAPYHPKPEAPTPEHVHELVVDHRSRPGNRQSRHRRT
nr:DUF1365 family protein [Oleomonas cavernae]